MLGLVEDFFFRILWMFNLSVGHHVLSLVKDDIIATVAGIVEVVRYVHLNSCWISHTPLETRATYVHIPLPVCSFKCKYMYMYMYLPMQSFILSLNSPVYLVCDAVCDSSPAS